MNQPLNQRWDLDVFFAGGTESPELPQAIAQLEADIAALAWRTGDLPVPVGIGQTGQLLEQILSMQSLTARLHEILSFLWCASAADVKDERAKLSLGKAYGVSAAIGNVETVLNQALLDMPEAAFHALLQDERATLIRFTLEERRARAREKLPVAQEKLVNDLSVDGYHAWGQLYDTVVGRMTIPWEEEGKTVELSVGQAFNKMQTGDRHLRAALFDKWQEAWAKEAELCGAALNHLGGYRLALYKQRGWESVLKEPLDNNRMTQATLDTMWAVIEEHKDQLVAFLDRKAKLMGVEKLGWVDYAAPFTTESRRISYDEAADFVVTNFHKFSPELADYAQFMFDQRWIEAEDRPGKGPGAFCSYFPVSNQTRVFMTFGGTGRGVSTLAHEIGHAYHGHVMNDLPLMARDVAMNVAETASTFGELIVSDAALQAAQTREERLALLDERLTGAVAYFMNIHARLLFELSFYEERRRGPVSVKRLNDLMETAQRTAFRDALGSWEPHFWASKGHFYATGAPFYNWPYTFGYLFSAGIYARALQEGPSFAGKYVGLLRDTGSMTTEDLANRHLGVDLTQPDFWRQAMGLTVSSVKEFLRLTDEMV